VTEETRDSRSAQALQELKLLVQAVVEKIEPALRNAAAAQAGGPFPHSGCEWCPVCALMALLRGENHELIAFLTAHGAALASFLRELLESADGDAADEAGLAARMTDFARDFAAFTGRTSTAPTAGEDQPEDGRDSAAEPPTRDGAGDGRGARRRRFEPIPVLIKT
jgi:hypothetical protein